MQRISSERHLQFRQSQGGGGGVCQEVQVWPSAFGPEGGSQCRRLRWGYRCHDLVIVFSGEQAQNLAPLLSWIDAARRCRIFDSVSHYCHWQCRGHQDGPDTDRNGPIGGRIASGGGKDGSSGGKSRGSADPCKRPGGGDGGSAPTPSAGGKESLGCSPKG